MFVVFVLVALVVVFTVVAVTLGHGDVLEVEENAETAELPERMVYPGDLDGLRFTVAARGYRMGQVDAVIDRLGHELGERDRRIAELEGRVNRSPLPQRQPGQSGTT